METTDECMRDGAATLQLIEVGNLMAEGQMSDLQRPDGSWDINATAEKLLVAAQKDIEAGRVLGQGLVFALGSRQVKFLPLTWEPNQQGEAEWYAAVNKLLRALYWTGQLQASNSCGRGLAYPRIAVRRGRATAGQAMAAAKDGRVGCDRA